MKNLKIFKENYCDISGCFLTCPMIHYFQANEDEKMGRIGSHRTFGEGRRDEESIEDDIRDN